MNRRRRFRAALSLAAVLPVLIGALAGCAEPIAGSATAAARGQAGQPAPSDGPGSSAPSTSAAEIDLAALVGAWEGSYTCNQGKTGLRLIIKPAESGSLPAIFEFFPLPGNEQAKAGSYTMRGSIEAGHLVFRGQRWIDQPQRYVMVDLSVTSASSNTLEGDISGSGGCSTFSVQRAGT